LRLEQFGFAPVYLYAAGKWDWFAHNLPMLGTRAALPQAKDVARPDVPTCGLREPIGEAHRRAQAAGWEQCIVVAEGRVILGRLRRDAWNALPETPAEEVMENGPTTVRPDELLSELLPRMQKRKVSDILVATPAGVLLGNISRAEAEAYVAAHPSGE
jgi:CBS domain-containing protein